MYSTTLSCMCHSARMRTIRLPVVRRPSRCNDGDLATTELLLPVSPRFSLSAATAVIDSDVFVRRFIIRRNNETDADDAGRSAVTAAAPVSSGRRITNCCSCRCCCANCIASCRISATDRRSAGQLGLKLPLHRSHGASTLNSAVRLHTTPSCRAVSWHFVIVPRSRVNAAVRRDSVVSTFCQWRYGFWVVGWGHGMRVHEIRKISHKFTFNHLTGTLKPQNKDPLYRNTVNGTLAVDGWAVTFGTVRNLGGLQPRRGPSSLYQM